MRIALDAMGSDKFPVPDITGALDAAREYGDTIILVGDEDCIRQELANHHTGSLPLEIIHAPQHITMADHPSQAARSKPDSSIHVATRMVASGEADACVTMGNTGAVLTIATLHTLKRIRGVKRPTLTSIIGIREKKIILTDMGANTDAKPEWIAQFGIMGSVYAASAMGLPNARVGLLSNGEEEDKGNIASREAHELLKDSGLNYIGNIEPRDVMKGHADVIVADGFVGNVFLKTMEAMAETMVGIIRTELVADPRSKMGGFLAKPAFRRVRRIIDPFEIGGAPLLGVNGVIIIGHGRSNALAVKNSIRQARLAVQGNVVNSIREQLATNGTDTKD
jgi:glycerol-3-phosphate acyltransferase PlsX